MKEYFSSAGIQTYTNPLASDGGLLHSVNMISFPYGAKSKRPGYNAFLGTPDNAQVQSLLAFPNINNSGTQMNLFRASGSAVYYSLQGTGVWTLAGNGTISNGAHFGAAVGNGGTVLIGGDGIGSTRHSTDGTSFTNTTLAPVAEFFADYQGRMYAAGSASNNFYSTTNDATNWNLSGTADSSSFRVPGEGKLQKIFKVSDSLIETKSAGHMFQWDGNAQVDMATSYGPSSPYAIAEAEGFYFYLNQFGHYGFDGGKPQLLSNPIQRYFYNRQNTGIAGTQFATIPGVCHYYDYFAAIGNVTDDFTQRPISNAVLNYNYQKNEYLMWQLNDKPTALLSYLDATGKRQMIFGNSTGQCFQLDPTATTDNGSVINTELVFLFTYADGQNTSFEKIWRWMRLYFNPGCEVNIQVAFANTFTYQHLKWLDITDMTPNPSQRTDDGIVELRFPQGSRSRLMFLRLYEATPNSQWTFYGCSIEATPMVIA
jgi:hypothetical protein